MDGQAQLIAALVAAVGVLWGSLSGLVIWAGRRLLAENAELKAALAAQTRAQVAQQQSTAKLLDLVPTLVAQVVARQPESEPPA